MRLQHDSHGLKEEPLHPSFIRSKGTLQDVMERQMVKLKKGNCRYWKLELEKETPLAESPVIILLDD